MQNIQQRKESNENYLSLCSIVSAVLCYSLSSFFQGYSMVYFNSIDYSEIEKIYSIELLSGEGQGLLSGCITFGAIFGCLLSAPVVSFFTRRHCFFFNNFLRVCSLILVLIPSFPTLLMGRILQGACVGIGGSIVPIMIKEYTPISLNGAMGAIHNACIGLGYLFGFLIALILSQAYQPQFYCAVVFGFPLLTIFLQLILLLTVFTSQTPKYLLLKGRNEEAKQVIASIYKEEYIDAIYHQKLRDLDADNPNLEKEEKQYPESSWVSIFLSFSFHFFPHFLGVGIISLYGKELVQKTLPAIAPSFGLLLNSIRAVFGTLSVFTVNKTGRRILFLAGLYTMSVALLLLFAGTSYYQENSYISSIFLLTGFFLYMSSYTMTVGPLKWIYPTEIVQPSWIPISTTTNWVSSWLLITLYPILRERAEDKSMPEMYIFFLICAIVKTLICLKFMVETKGKTQTEIRQELNMICT